MDEMNLDGTIEETTNPIDAILAEVDNSNDSENSPNKKSKKGFAKFKKSLGEKKSKIKKKLKKNERIGESIESEESDDDEILTTEDLLADIDLNVSTESSDEVEEDEDTIEDIETTLEEAIGFDSEFVEVFDKKVNKNNKKSAKKAAKAEKKANKHKISIEKKRVKLEEKKAKCKNEKQIAKIDKKIASLGVKKKRVNPLQSIAIKIITVCAIPMVVVSMIIITLSVNTLRSAMEEQISGALMIVATSVNETYTNLYEGDYSQGKGGQITKGDKKISKDNKLIDGLKEQTGYDISFVFGNMRLITTLKKDSGKRMNGTKIDEELFARIQAGEEVFLTDGVIDEKNYFIYYQPLVNSDGSILGCIETATSSDSVNELINSQTSTILAVSLIFVVIAIIFALIISSALASAMKKTKEFLGLIRDGKLDAVPDKKASKRKDEIGEIYKSSIQLQQTLYKIVDDIMQAANNLTDSAADLSLMAQNTQGTVKEVVSITGDIAERASSQAMDAKITSDGVLEMNEEIKNLKDDMKSLVDYAGTMASSEKQSQDIIGELNEQAITTRESLDRVSAQIEVMNNSVQGIEKAITLISDIADETDLLSLNASIEAARAGEAGRGFSVVAEQIGKLADQSTRSADEINLIIKNVMEISKDTVEIMNQVYAAMDLQQQKMDATKDQSKIVSEGINKSLDEINVISEKIDTLRESSHDIKESVTVLAGISEKTATTANSTIESVDSMNDTMAELNESAEKLTVLAERLNASLDVFNL